MYPESHIFLLGWETFTAGGVWKLRIIRINNNYCYHEPKKKDKNFSFILSSICFAWSKM